MTAKSPRVHAVQRRFISKLSPEKQAEARQKLAKQNRFARKVGLPLMTVMMNLLIASMIISVLVRVLLGMIEDGVLTPPDSVRRAADARGQR